MSANISYLTDIMQCFHSWQKVPNPQYFMRTPPYILPTLLSQIFSPPPPSPTNIQTTALFTAFGWIGDRAKFDVLFYLMTLWICLCQAKVT